MVAFNQISNTLRVPIVTAEFDSSAAQQGPALLAYRGLLIGQKTASGSQAPDTVVKVTNENDVIAKAGRGSMLHRQYIGWSANNKSTELWLGVLADDGAGVAATGTIVVAGPATKDGTIALYLGGVRITIGVHKDDAAADIATAIAAAITAKPDLPVTAAAATATVTITYRHKGLVGNSYDVRHSFQDGESLPAGVGLTITAVGTATAGTSNPSLTNLIAAMTDMWFHIWSHGYVDATGLTALENELESRRGPMRMIDGVAITSISGSFSALTTLGAARDSPSSLIVAQPGASPLTPPVEFAAEVAGIVAKYGAQDPARPFQTLALTHTVAPAETDQFSFDERNLMLFDGVATTKRTAGGGVALERMITTYQTNAAGSPDTAYLDVTTPLSLMYARYDWRVTIQTKYPRHKLGNDVDSAGNPIQYGSGDAVMTPSLGKAEAISWFEGMQLLGIFESSADALDQFKRDLVVVRNPSDPNRMDWLLQPDLMNQLMVNAAQIKFLL